MNAPAKPKQQRRLLQRHVEGARLFSDRYEMMESLPKSEIDTVAEIGVAYGEFSEFLLDRLAPKRFDAFDIFRMHTWERYAGRQTKVVFGGKTHGDFYRTKFAGDCRVRVHDGDSSTNLMRVEEAAYDLIYIDGDHTYEGVLRDAIAAEHKLKPAGYLVFNDYIIYDHNAREPYGVVQVVNDLCLQRDWKITHFALSPTMFCDVILRRG